ncbi:hypothetical protein HY411_02505 [Candidatus Gottesmanbacteria bacterium]|nr:hypothetical protein [Candidatus Gottesmanbacteria bacterium]
MTDRLLIQLYRRPETVFPIDQIAQMFPGIPYKSLRDRLSYCTKTGKLIRVRHGIYAKPSYNHLELANKIYTPSYISLETVLAKEGIVFQYYETIFAVSYLTRTVSVAGKDIQYRQIKGIVLTNPHGVEYHDEVAIASRERAFLDAVYIYKDYHFDNLGVIDWQKVDELTPVYRSKTVKKRIAGYRKLYQEDYAQH